jgi:hypothetical protein
VLFEDVEDKPQKQPEPAPQAQKAK